MNNTTDTPKTTADFSDVLDKEFLAWLLYETQTDVPGSAAWRALDDKDREKYRQRAGKMLEKARELFPTYGAPAPSKKLISVLRDIITQPAVLAYTLPGLED